MKVLIACEESGRVRDEFIARGHDAVSLDLLPTSAPGPHRQEPLTADVLAEGWDLVVAFPPCTDLSNAGSCHWPKKQADGRQAAAFEFVKSIYDSPVPKVAVENPVGWLNTHWRKPDQIVDPWNFGDPFRKRTCLWLKGLPKLAAEITEEPADLEYWVTGQSRRRADGTRGYVAGEAPERRGSDKAFIRSKTFPGIARAMAENWG